MFTKYSVSWMADKNKGEESTVQAKPFQFQFFRLPGGLRDRRSRKPAVRDGQRERRPEGPAVREGLRDRRPGKPGVRDGIRDRRP